MIYVTESYFLENSAKINFLKSWIWLGNLGYRKSITMMEVP